MVKIGPGLETSVCEGIHTFLNIYMDFKYRFAGLWDFGDWVSLLLSRGSADSQKCLICKDKDLIRAKVSLDIMELGFFDFKALVKINS